MILHIFIGLMAGFGFAFSLASLAGIQNGSARNARSDDTLVGDWRGESICIVRPSGCHDEDSLYHVASLPKKPGWFLLKADKIVDGKPVTVGTSECSYTQKERLLECHLPAGTLQFDVRDDRLEGTMKLRDGTLWRKLRLKKSE